MNVLLTYCPHTAAAMWVGSALFGFAMASVFPSGIHLIEGYIDVTGAVATVFVAAASAGEMSMPLAYGALLDRRIDTTFLQLFLYLLIASTINFAVMVIYGKYRNPGRRSPPPPTNTMDEAESTTTTALEYTGGDGAMGGSGGDDDDDDALARRAPGPNESEV